MDDQGWIKLHRQIQDNEFWLSEKFTRAQAWIDLLLMANHKDSMFFLRGNEVKVKRGQISRAETTLAKRWRWSRNKVRRFLEWLKTKQQIKQQKGSVINILEIINYEKFQQNDTTDDTTERQQKDNRKDTYNNVKNVENEKNNKYSALFQELWQDFPNKIGKKEAEKHFNASVLTEEDCKNIQIADKKYKQHLKKNDWKKPQNGKTWFNNWQDFVDYDEYDHEETNYEPPQKYKEREQKPGIDY